MTGASSWAERNEAARKRRSALGAAARRRGASWELLDFIVAARGIFGIEGRRRSARRALQHRVNRRQHGQGRKRGKNQAADHGAVERRGLAAAFAETDGHR